MFKSLKGACSLAIIANAATEQEKARYSMWNDKMEERNFEWESYVVESEDFWYLTLFRVTGIHGKPKKKKEGTLPILLLHGVFSNATTWFDIDYYFPIPDGIA